MAYADAKVASVAWLAGNVFYQLTEKMLSETATGGDLDALNDGVMLMQVATRYYTSQDEDFQREWEEIEDEIKEAEDRGYDPTVHRDRLAKFRFKQLDAMFTSMVRMGKLAFQEGEDTDWTI